jgi:hypothetical protein
MFLTRLHYRIMRAGLAADCNTPPGMPCHAATANQAPIDDIIRDAGLAD